MKTLKLFLALILAVSMNGCGGNNEQSNASGANSDPKMDEMMKLIASQEQNMAFCQKMNDEAINQGKFEEVEKNITADFKDHDPLNQKGDLAGVKETFAMFRAGVPDLHQEIVHIAANKDIVIQHVHLTGTMTGEMMGMKPTGKKFDLMGADVFKFEGDKVSEHWGYFDVNEMMNQLGLNPGK